MENTKKVLITGASGGIGRAIAKKFLENGCSEAHFLFPADVKIAKNRGVLLVVLYENKARKIVAPAGFELFACIFGVVFL